MKSDKNSLVSILKYLILSVSALGSLALLFLAYLNSYAQPVVTDTAGLTNRNDSILLYNAASWNVSTLAPDEITDGFSLRESHFVNTLHLDSLRTVLGESRYGWAELAFEMSDLPGDTIMIARNIGFGAIRIWLNGELVFEDGNPAQNKSAERLSRLNMMENAPVRVRNGVNYLLIEFSYHRVPEWLHRMRANPQQYFRPLLSTQSGFITHTQIQKNRTLLFGAVSFVLFILALAHLYLSLKSVNRYHLYAFRTNLFLLLHTLTQMGDTIFAWSFSMYPLVFISHALLFLLVFYNMLHVIGCYYSLPLPKTFLRITLWVSSLIAVYSELFNYQIVNLILPLLAVITIVYALYLLRMAIHGNHGHRVSILFAGFMAMLAGALLYVMVYVLFFQYSTVVFFAAVLLVYVGVPVSFTATIALDFVDIYEKMEQKVIERTKELQEKEAFKTRFFLNVSHELRTPTTILEGLLQKAKQQSSGKPGILIGEEDASLVMRNAKRLSVLVQQILDLSRSDKGELTLQKKNFKLDEIIRSVVELHRSFIALKQQTVSFHSNTQDTIVNVDGEKISTIISNVLLNASKYGPENSNIRIETNINHRDDVIEVDIIDEGDGVSVQDYEIIFERFHRIKNPDKPYVEGLGIGLELSRSLARLHNGELALADQREKGARFRLTLPFNAEMVIHSIRDTAAQQAVPDHLNGNEPASAPHSSKLRLLLVEDNPDMNAYVKGLLSPLGEVHSCKNGVQALAYLQKNTVDLVVTDLMMPEMTGGELIRHMAADPALATIPVVVLSAKNDGDERLQLLRVGIVDYITKPFDASELILKIENLMRFYNRRQTYSVDVPADEVPEEASLSESVKNYILENIDDNRLSAPFLADAFAMSERSFYRKIEKDSGMTPAAFLREVRLQYAARLVETSSDIRISELAYKIGYKSVDTFRKNYIDRFGLSPKQH